MKYLEEEYGIDFTLEQLKKINEIVEHYIITRRGVIM